MLLAAAPYWKGRAPALEQPLGAGPAAAMLYLEDYLESECVRGGGAGRPGTAGAGEPGEAAARRRRSPLPHGSELLTGSLPPPSLPLPRVPAVIEQLPMDLRDRFTEMREMDLQVQST